MREVYVVVATAGKIDRRPVESLEGQVVPKGVDVIDWAAEQISDKYLDVAVARENLEVYSLSDFCLAINDQVKDTFDFEWVAYVYKEAEND